MKKIVTLILGSTAYYLKGVEAFNGETHLLIAGIASQILQQNSP
jgi:hypothetical protein